jgi:hypothetical protein
MHQELERSGDRHYSDIAVRITDLGDMEAAQAWMCDGVKAIPVPGR